jgi:hypothetical protein
MKAQPVREDDMKSSKPFVPIEAFLQLERMVQDVRLWVMKQVEGRTDVEQCASIKSILARSAENPQLLSNKDILDKSPDCPLTLKGCLLLESRMHNLRKLAIITAATMVGDHPDNKVTEPILKDAWDQVLSSENLRRSALLSDSGHAK